MNNLRIMLNNRKRFVFLAAMAAGLVLLAGGANALAQPTVRCVPTTNPDPRCTGAPTYPTIQAAVTAAGAGDIILVATGYYNESVTIGSTLAGLALLGAQAGNDARVDRHDPNKESIVDATGTAVGSGIIVEASNVVVDGFTVQGATANVGTATGIDLKGLCYTVFSPANGSAVVNNIIQKNANGISLNQEACGTPGNSSYPSPSSASLVGVLVEHNLIKNNNSATLGYGNGINAGGVNLALITENAFQRNLNIAISILNSNHVTTTNNTSESDGIFALFDNTSNSDFSDNHGEGFAAEGSPLTGPVGAVTIAASNGLVISDNNLEKGNHPIDDGIELGSYKAPAPPPSQNLYVKNNKIKRFPGNGIYADMDAFVNSFILGNEVEKNDLDGIFIFGLGNVGNSFFDNKAEGNSKIDCEDDTTGSGTLGTANRWFSNTGNSSSPNGLCTAGRRHDHD